MPRGTHKCEVPVGPVCNTVVLAATFSNPRLHNPKYLFLSQLALVVIICTTMIMPKMLGSLLTLRNTISFSEGMFQLYLFMCCLGKKTALFTVMPYDHCMAKFFILHRSTRMSMRECMGLSAMINAVISSWVHKRLILPLTFCSPRIMNHSFTHCWHSPAALRGSLKS
ncbi:hypothetical protein QYF61_005820 [Mycteria americana]|uniref:Uncharacterized protein n=1 Tax=Mycteria americana TaxID=33587 RepID=A0AAN7RUV7_MYCAM|nr:hypothetical protein QYF61_005820 [Mycteria americana]